MTNFYIRRSFRKVRQTKHGGLLLIRQKLSQYTPLGYLTRECGQKLFGISIVAVLFAMVARSLLGGGSLRDFEEKWNKDPVKGVIAGYRKKLTHRLLGRNLLRFNPQVTRKVVIGTVKTLFERRRITISRVAIDSTKILVKGTKYPKKGTVKIKSKYYTGYKLSIVFDVVAKIPVAYILTSLNVHDSQLLIPLVKMVQSEFNNCMREVVIDRAYYGAEFFNFLDQQGIRWTIPAKRYKALKEAIIKARYGDFIKIGKGNVRYHETTLELTGYGTVRCLLIAFKKFEDWMPEEEKSAAIWALITNHPKRSPKKIIQGYKERWQIEIFFRACKSNLGLNNLPGHDYRQINAHVGVVLLAYLALTITVIDETETTGNFPIAIQEWLYEFIYVVVTCRLRFDWVELSFLESSTVYWCFQNAYPGGKVKM